MCVLCGDPATGQGEHVLPRWFLKRYAATTKSFTRLVNGTPIAGRGGSPFVEYPIAAVLLPVCGVNAANDCNGWLRDEFEKPRQPAVEDVLNGRGLFDTVRVYAFARWWVKTLFLRCHPQSEDKTNARIRQPGVPDRVATSRPWDIREDLYPQLRATGQFLDDLSLWATFVDLRDPGVPLPDDPHVGQHRTVRADGGGGLGQVATKGYLTAAYRSGRPLVLSLQLVYHPLCNIAHPFEAAGVATRLWPNPPALLDPATHPVIGKTQHDQWARTFRPSGGRIGLDGYPGGRLPADGGFLSVLGVAPR
jgi:hypothetical protein